MKKLFTLCLFVFGLLLTTQSVNAQQKFSTEVNQKAYQKAVEYGRHLKADQETQEAMYTAFQEYYDKTNTLNKTQKIGSSGYTDLETKINKRLLTSLESVLNEEQFGKYLELTDQIRDE